MVAPIFPAFYWVLKAFFATKVGYGAWKLITNGLSVPLALKSIIEDGFAVIGHTPTVGKFGTTLLDAYSVRSYDEALKVYEELRAMEAEIIRQGRYLNNLTDVYDLFQRACWLPFSRYAKAAAVGERSTIQSLDEGLFEACRALYFCGASQHQLSHRQQGKMQFRLAELYHQIDRTEYDNVEELVLLLNPESAQQFLFAFAATPECKKLATTYDDPHAHHAVSYALGFTEEPSAHPHKRRILESLEDAAKAEKPVPA